MDAVDEKLVRSIVKLSGRLNRRLKSTSPNRTDAVSELTAAVAALDVLGRRLKSTKTKTAGKNPNDAKKRPVIRPPADDGKRPSTTVRDVRDRPVVFVLPTTNSTTAATNDMMTSTNAGQSTTPTTTTANRPVDVRDLQSKQTTTTTMPTTTTTMMATTTKPEPSSILHSTIDASSSPLISPIQVTVQLVSTTIDTKRSPTTMVSTTDSTTVSTTDSTTVSTTDSTTVSTTAADQPRPTTQKTPPPGTTVPSKPESIPSTQPVPPPYSPVPPPYSPASDETGMAAVDADAISLLRMIDDRKTIDERPQPPIDAWNPFGMAALIQTIGADKKSTAAAKNWPISPSSITKPAGTADGKSSLPTIRPLDFTAFVDDDLPDSEILVYRNWPAPVPIMQNGIGQIGNRTASGTGGKSRLLAASRYPAVKPMSMSKPAGIVDTKTNGISSTTTTTTTNRPTSATAIATDGNRPTTTERCLIACPMQLACRLSPVACGMVHGQFAVDQAFPPTPELQQIRSRACPLNVMKHHLILTDRKNDSFQWSCPYGPNCTMRHFRQLREPLSVAAVHAIMSNGRRSC